MRVFSLLLELFRCRKTRTKTKECFLGKSVGNGSLDALCDTARQESALANNTDSFLVAVFRQEVLKSLTLQHSAGCSDRA